MQLNTEKSKSNFISKINIVSSYIWLVSTLGFIIVILLSTKWFTHDPCYGSGCVEHVYLLPMLLTLSFGCLFFGLMILSGLIKIIKKTDQWTPPFNIGSWKIVAINIFVLSLFGVYFIASMRNGVNFGGTYTGNDLFNAVNEYRARKNLGALQLSEGLCDNLVSRWQAVKNDKQHEGFEDWVKTEGIQSQYGYKQVVELYIKSPTPQGAIEFWTNSPGHKIQIDNPQWTDGCAYANENIGVVVMGNK
jgi:hypothetical protein